jgi:hypothetical protein
MPKNWAAQLAERFDLRLPDDVVSWFDKEVWKRQSSASFNQPVSPNDIGDSVWGGQMLPDTLPILGNGGGDCLCLRFGSDGTVTEVIRWLHEGGLWTSYGNTLAEALLFDAALFDAVEQVENGTYPFVDWVLEGADQTISLDKVRLALTEDGRPSHEGLLRAGLAETPVRWKFCERAWMSGLEQYCRRTLGSRGLGKKLGVDWNEIHKWFFDTALVPEKFRKRIAEITAQSAEPLLAQDWEGAQEHAEAVIRLRKDLSWPFAASGWAAERQGDRARAIKLYQAGLAALGSAAEFTADWGRPAGEWHTKFVIDRLCDLRDELPTDLRQDGYLSAAADRANRPYDKVRECWLKRGEEAERQQRHDLAYWFYYRVGWDLFFADDMELILERLEHAANAAGWRPLAKLAAHHRHQARIGSR